MRKHEELFIACEYVLETKNLYSFHEISENPRVVMSSLKKMERDIIKNSTFGVFYVIKVSKKEFLDRLSSKSNLIDLIDYYRHKRDKTIIWEKRGEAPLFEGGW